MTAPSTAKPKSTSVRQGNFLQDALASVVVFLVALPLCLGIAIASGYPPEAGLISGIIGGLVVGTLAGCPLQVSGPAAGLITLVYEFLMTHGAEQLAVAIMLGGSLQLLMGCLGLGQWFRAVSPAVIQGMLAGIGVMIFASQFHVMVDDTPKANSIENIISIPGAVEKGLFPLAEFSTPHHLAAAIGILTIVSLVLWKVLPEKVQRIPAPLVAVGTASIAAAVFGLPINYVEVPQNMLGSLQLPTWNAWRFLENPDIWTVGVAIAFIASAETLLTATAVDKLVLDGNQQNVPRTRYNREIFAQGVGNVLAGLLGALPITGVIVRSSANVQAGGQTRVSTILHGFWLLILVMFFPVVLATIPIASLAAILVYTGYKLVNIQAIQRLARFGKGEVFVYFATLVSIIATNLLEGVLIGLALASLKLFYQFSRLEVETQHTGEQVNVYLTGSASFITIPKLATEFEALPSQKNIAIQFGKLNHIDHAAVDFLQSWEERYEKEGGCVEIEWDGLMGRAQAAPPQPVVDETAVA